MVFHLSAISGHKKNSWQDKHYISSTVDNNNDLFQGLETANYVKKPKQKSADFITNETATIGLLQAFSSQNEVPLFHSHSVLVDN